MKLVEALQAAQSSISEKTILEHKHFYKRYLSKVASRQRASQELFPLCAKFMGKKPVVLLTPDRETIRLKVEAESILEKHFGAEVVSLFNKELPKPNLKKKYNERIEDSFWLTLLVGFNESMEQLQEMHKQEWNYKTNFLIFINHCLACYGLHENILRRDPNTYKRYNLMVYYFQRSKKEKAIVSKPLLTYKELESQFLNLYVKQKPIKFGGRLVTFKSIDEIKITTTLLLEDEIELFGLKNGFQWDEQEKDTLAFIDCCQDETEKYHPNPFEESSHDRQTDVLNLQLVGNLLAAYPKSHKLFVSALEKFEKKEYQRNVLDDLRLSMELLLKAVFNNSKSLENQLQEIGKLQNKKGASVEMTNMFLKLIDYYTKYQNNYVKHNDAVKESEIESIIDLTVIFFKIIIKE